MYLFLYLFTRATVTSSLPLVLLYVLQDLMASRNESLWWAWGYHRKLDTLEHTTNSTAQRLSHAYDSNWGTSSVEHNHRFVDQPKKMPRAAQMFNEKMVWSWDVSGQAWPLPLPFSASGELCTGHDLMTPIWWIPAAHGSGVPASFAELMGKNVAGLAPGSQFC